jgi:hypothetical protein
MISKPFKCKSCGENIVFVGTVKGNKMPINYDTYDNERMYTRGVHTPHFVTCPDAAKFRKEKKNVG